MNQQQVQIFPLCTQGIARLPPFAKDMKGSLIVHLLPPIIFLCQLLLMMNFTLDRADYATASLVCARRRRHAPDRNLYRRKVFTINSSCGKVIVIVSEQLNTVLE